MTTIFVRIEVNEAFRRPGIRMAQVLRYIAPIIETMMPLKNGSVPDRLDGKTTLAEWTVVDGTRNLPEQQHDNQQQRQRDRNPV